MKLLNNLIIAFFLCNATLLNAFTVVPEADWSGSISTAPADGPSMIADDGWRTEYGGIKVGWVITDDEGGPATYHYTYIISKEDDTALTKEASHITIEVSETLSLNDLILVSPTPPAAFGDPQWYDIGNPDNNSHPADIRVDLFGVKFDLPEGTGALPVIDFYTNRIPIWGNIYLKDGKMKIDGEKINAYAYNTGLNPDYEGTPAFLPIPDTGTEIIIPEPSTYLLLGSLLMVCLVLKRKRVAYFLR